jgi:hypothetical protein
LIPSLILIVAGYVMFRCIEVFCKQRDGQYTKGGFTFLLICATALFIATALLAISAAFSPTPTIPAR